MHNKLSIIEYKEELPAITQRTAQKLATLAKTIKRSRERNCLFRPFVYNQLIFLVCLQNHSS